MVGTTGGAISLLLALSVCRNRLISTGIGFLIINLNGIVIVFSFAIDFIVVTSITATLAHHTVHPSFGVRIIPTLPDLFLFLLDLQNQPAIDQCARQGFAQGLTILVGAITSIGVDALLKLIVDLLEVSSSMKGQVGKSF